jgi:hypothetical protein
MKKRELLLKEEAVLEKERNKRSDEKLRVYKKRFSEMKAF